MVGQLGQVYADLGDDSQAWYNAWVASSTTAGFVRHDLGLPQYSGSAS
jgi:hypothetical protein